MAQPRQYRLLVIERSRTLGHGLKALLEDAAGGALGATLDFVDSYDLALRRLRMAPDAYAGVVLGWPRADEQESDAFRALLSNPGLRRGYALVLSQERVPAARAWANSHGDADYVLWNDADEIYHSLDQALGKLPPADRSALLPASDGDQALSFLLVDDSAASRVFFRRLLGTRGYIVDTAASVSEARSKLGQRHYDVAIIDYYLPELNGDAFVREIKADPETSGLTCCVITGAGSDTLIRDSLDAGAIECLFKNEAGELLLSQIDAIARTVRGTRILYEKEQLLDGILDSVGEGVLGVDDAGQVAFANARAVEMLGFASESAIKGYDSERLFVSTGRDGNSVGITWMRMAYASRGFLKPLARQMHHRDGSIVDVVVSAYPLRIREREIGTVVSVREVQNDRSLERQAWWHVTHDVDTGVLNRRYFEVQIESELHQLKRTKASHALLMVALENNGQGEDNSGVYANGHGASNGHARQRREVDVELLRDVANKLVDRARSSDLVASFGHGKFALLLRDAAPEYASSIQAGFKSLLQQVVNDHADMTASAGIAVLDGSIGSPKEIIALASLAQRVASGKGLKGITFHLSAQSDQHQDAHDDAAVMGEVSSIV